MIINAEIVSIECFFPKSKIDCIYFLKIILKDKTVVLLEGELGDVGKAMSIAEKNDEKELHNHIDNMIYQKKLLLIQNNNNFGVFARCLKMTNLT